MSMDLMSLVKTALSSEALDKLGSNLGESPANTQTALQAGVPALLAAMIAKLSSAGGVSSLLALFNSGSAGNNVLSDLSGALSGTGASNLMSTGKGIIQSLLGDKMGSVAGAMPLASVVPWA